MSAFAYGIAGRLVSPEPSLWESFTRWGRDRIHAGREARRPRFLLRPRRTRVRHRVLFAAATHRVATPLTTNVTSYASGAFTPAAGELVVAFVNVTASRDDSGAGLAKLTGSQNLGFVKVDRAHKATNVDSTYVFVASAFAAASSMTLTFDCTGDAGTGVVIQAFGLSGMTRTGIDAVRQTAKQENAAAGAVVPVFAANALTGNPVAGVVHNATNPATMTAPAGWSEQNDTGYATPTTGAEYMTRDSGFTGTTVTWGGTSASAFCALIIEFDASAATSSCPYVALTGATATAGNGNLTVVPPAGIVADDICVIVVSQADQVATTLSDGAYTQKWSQDQGTALRQRGFWKRSTGSESNVTVNHAAGNGITGYMVVVRGAITTGDPFDVVTPQANTATATVTSANVTPTVESTCVLFCASEELSGNTSGSPTYQVWTGTYPAFQEVAQGANGLGSNEITSACAWGGSNGTTALGARTVTVVNEAATPTGNVATLALLKGEPVAGAADASLAFVSRLTRRRNRM